jgi:hypothetical protein
MQETVPTILLALMVLVSSQSSSSLWLSLYYLLKAPGTVLLKSKAQKAHRKLQRLAPWSPISAVPCNKKWVLSPVSATWVSHTTENPTVTTCLLNGSFISDCRRNYVIKWTTLLTTLQMLHFYKHWPVTLLVLLVRTTPFSSGSLGTDAPYIMQKCHKL